MSGKGAKPPRLPAISADLLADLIGVTPRRVRQLAKDGVIPKPRAGLYNPRGAIRGYLEHQRRAADGGEAREVLDKHRGSYMRARARRAEIEVRKLKGELVERKVAERTGFEWSRRLRDRWLILPPREAPIIASRTRADPVRLAAELERMIRAEVHAQAEDTLRLADEQPAPRDRAHGDAEADDTSGDES